MTVKYKQFEKGVYASVWLGVTAPDRPKKYSFLFPLNNLKLNEWMDFFEIYMVHDHK